MTDSTQKKRLFSALRSGAYDRALAIANTIVSAPRRLLELIQKGRDKTVSRLQSAGNAVVSDTNAALRLLQSYAEGSYREVSKDNLVLLIAAMAYFIAPIDAIPDFFLGIGITDDLALMTWTFSKLKEELEYFKSWEAQQQSIDPDNSILPAPSNPPSVDGAKDTQPLRVTINQNHPLLLASSTQENTLMLARYDNVYAAIGRFLLGLYFVVPGITKITGYAGTLAYMQSKGVPLAEVLLPITIALQVGLGLLIIINRQVRISALLLFGLTIIINIYMHNFWALAGDPSQAHETQNFVKNLAIAAGLLVLAGRSNNK